MVDAATNVVYGHVVAFNPLGEIYVVPMSATVKQIQSVFQTANVRLADPLPLLTSLVVSYLTSKQYIQAKAAIIALCDLVKSLLRSQRWPLLVSWAVSASRDSLFDLSDDELSVELVRVFLPLFLSYIMDLC